MKKNKIYIGGGFTEDQLLWIVPIVSYYSKKNSNNLFIFENELSKLDDSVVIMCSVETK